ncbi:M20 family metallo-hydrolase [Halotalea alkalilenta]|nr:M20 family metallo-hydrolase [Halotalea alkalilenta]
MKIVTDNVINDLRALAKIGASGAGLTRIALSDADMAARRWLMERMSQVGLEPRLDSVGNVHGRMPGVTQAVLVGSHLDSVPGGGWLDACTRVGLDGRQPETLERERYLAYFEAHIEQEPRLDAGRAALHFAVECERALAEADGQRPPLR